jgi:predicted nucleic acid-binding protein
MKVADTTALYAFFTPDDAHHEKAKRALSKPEPIVVPAEIYAETVQLIQYRKGFAVARASAAVLDSLPHLEVQPTPDHYPEDILGEARRTHLLEAGRLSLYDAVVVAWCRKRGLRPLTYDEAILKALSG